MHLFSHTINCLELGYSNATPDFTLDERRKMGANIEEILKGEKEAARAPSTDN